MTEDAPAAETAAQSAAAATPAERRPEPLVMIEADDVQACTVDGACW